MAKLFGMVAQIALARLLLPSDFGLVAEATLVVTLLSLPQSSFIGQVLIRRQAEIRSWANPAFWLSLLLGCGCALAMLLAGPLAARWYAEPQLCTLIWIYAAAAPINAIGSVSQALLQARLQFRQLAQIGTLSAACTGLASVVLAKLGFGAIAILGPIAALGAARSIALFVIEPPPLLWNVEVGRWRAMAADSFLLFVTALCLTLIGQGDYFALANLRNEAELGRYFFAFGLSVQAVGLIVANLGGVLLPSFSILHSEPQRQLQAFFRATRLIAFVGVPLCVLQAVLADPLIPLVYGERWRAAVPIFQILSVATAFVLVTGPATSFLQARGKFGLLAAEAVVIAVVFIALVNTGAHVGAAKGVAVAVLVFDVVCGPIGIWLAIPRGAVPNPWARVFGIYAPSTLASGAAAALSFVGARFSSEIGVSDLSTKGAVAHAIISGAIFTIVYVAAMWAYSRREFAELLERVLPSSVLSQSWIQQLIKP